MKQTSFRELQSILTQLEGKKIEVSISILPDNVISTNTYTYFNWLIHEQENLIFDDLNDKQNSVQRCFINTTDIDKIYLLNTEDIHSEVIFIIANGLKIALCVLDVVRCGKCQKVINTPKENAWEIDGCGNYGTQYDGEQLKLQICDHCLTEWIGGEFGE